MSETVKKSRRIRGGALLIVAVLLVSSAALRIGLQAGAALAKETPEPMEYGSDTTQLMEPQSDHLQEDQHMATAAPMGQQTEMVPEDLQHLLSALRNREQQLNRRETQIEDRMKALEIADHAIEKKLAALVEAEERLSATLALADGASEGDLAKLTEVYEKMKPKETAALFEEMSPEFAAGFLGRMKPTAAASVMAGLTPKTAYTISVILAGRNAWVPKE